LFDRLFIANRWCSQFQELTVDVRRRTSELKVIVKVIANAYRKLPPGRKQSQKTTNVTQPPLFPVAIANISPPQLHISLGVGKRLYESLERACWEADKAAVGLAPDTDAKKVLAKSMNRLKKLEDRIEDMKVRAAQERSLLEIVKSAVQTTQQNDANLCEGLICLIPQLQSASLHEKVSDWISCADCKRWVHFACDGVSTTYEIAILTAAPYRCLVVHYPACKRQKQPADEEQFLSFQLASSYLAVHWLEQFRRLDGPPVARFTSRRKRTQQHEVPLLVVSCFFAPRVRCICSWTLL
jgi:hypothetical protein